MKAANAPALVAILVGNLALLFILAGRHAVVATGHVAGLLPTPSAAAWGAGAAALVGILNSQIPSTLKERIVFMRWQNALPGCRAFSLHMHADPRIDVKSLHARHGPFPSAPVDQNRLWYALYRRHENVSAVSSVHRAYLLARDYASIALLLLVTLGPVSVLVIARALDQVMFVAVLLAQLGLAIRAGRDRGIRLVTTVLAIEATDAKGRGHD